MATRLARVSDTIQLAAIRAAAGLTQAELGKRWGKGQRAVSHIESHNDWSLSNLVSYLKSAGAHVTLSVGLAEDEFIFQL